MCILSAGVHGLGQADGFGGQTTDDDHTGEQRVMNRRVGEREKVRDREESVCCSDESDEKSVR